MLIGFIIFGLGWSLIWQAQGKSATHSVLDMPLWFSSSNSKVILSLLTIIFGILHLIIAIYIFSWIGIIFWIVCAVLTQLISSIIFNNSRTKNPAPPFFTGIVLIIIGLIIIMTNKN